MADKRTSKVKISSSNISPRSPRRLQKAQDRSSIQQDAAMYSSKEKKRKEDASSHIKSINIAEVSSIAENPLQSLPSQEQVPPATLPSTVHPQRVVTDLILTPTRPAVFMNSNQVPLQQVFIPANFTSSTQNPSPSCSMNLSSVIPTSFIAPHMNPLTGMVPGKQYPVLLNSSNTVVSSLGNQTSRVLLSPQSCLPVTNILRPISVVGNRMPLSSNKPIFTIVTNNAGLPERVYSKNICIPSSSATVTTTVKSPISTGHLSVSPNTQTNSSKAEPMKQPDSTSSTNRTSTKGPVHSAKCIYSSDSLDSESVTDSLSEPMDSYCESSSSGSEIENSKGKVEQNGHKPSNKRFSSRFGTRKKVKRDSHSSSHSSASSVSSKAEVVSTSSKAVSCFIVSISPHPDLNTVTMGYDCLNMIFKYLKISDLLSVAQVSKSWNSLVSQRFLWEKVSFKDYYVRDWAKCTESLKKYGTKVLNLRGMHLGEENYLWKDFIKNLNKLSAIEHITFGQVPPAVLEAVADSMPLLECLECYCLTKTYKRPDLWSTPCKLKFFNWRFLRKLKKLKIRSAGGLLCESEPTEFKNLTNLQHLSLTSLKNFPGSNFRFLAQLPNLVSLELGDCNTWQTKNYEIIGKLTNLRQLRLENGGGFHIGLTDALFRLTKLEELELMKFKMPDDLSSAIEVLLHLNKLSLWPDTSEKQAARVNYNAFQAATKAKHVTYFCWGIISPDDCIPLLPILKDPSECSNRGFNIVFDEVHYEDFFERLCNAMPEAKVEIKCISEDYLNEYCSLQR